MLYKEALDKITNLAVTYSQIDADICELLTIAKKAIEKQISKKPVDICKTIKIKRNGEDTIIRNVCCPCCGGIVDGDYCYSCGQAIDWSDEG